MIITGGKYWLEAGKGVQTATIATTTALAFIGAFHANNLLKARRVSSTRPPT